MWTYRCYDDGDQPYLWRRWFDSAPDVHGSHDTVFRGLEQVDVWKKPWTDFIDKKNRILEVRLVGSVEWRVFGFYSEVTRREFIVLATGFHKQRVYTPADIKKTLVKRKKEVEANLGKAPICVRPTAT